jgi:hypothetical protein
MTYSSKRIIASLFSEIIIFIAYLIYALGDASPGPENVKEWTTAMLIFIGSGIVVLIAIQIIFHVIFSIGTAFGMAIKNQEVDDKEIERKISSTMVEDEMNKLISLKASRIGSSFIGIGFVAFLAALAFGMTIVFTLHILLGSFLIGAFAEGVASVYFYERGISNG